MSRGAGQLRPLAAASHLALWPGLYAAASVYCLAHLAGLWPDLDPLHQFAALAFTACVATATYLLDRVKLADRWLDPADRAAHPARFEFIARRSRTIRAAAFTLLALTALLAISARPWAALAIPAAVVGIFIYAGRPRTRRARVKDILLAKNLFVAAGLTGFGLIVLAASARRPADLLDHPATLAASAIHLLIRIWADATLCDLDDEHADRAHGTVTLPTELGRHRAWNTAGAVRLALAAALLTIMPGPRGPRLAWGLVTIVSSISLRAAAPRAVRDWVDARFPLEALAAALLARAF